MTTVLINRQLQQADITYQILLIKLIPRLMKGR